MNLLDLFCRAGYQGGFSNRLLLKDVKLARGAAQAVGEHTPMASMAESLWEGLCDGGHSDLDQGSIYEQVYRAKAVDPPPDA
jgi:3-hydroxyisobutyrate dehydrogenase